MAIWKQPAHDSQIKTVIDQYPVLDIKNRIIRIPTNSNIIVKTDNIYFDVLLVLTNSEYYSTHLKNFCLFQTPNTNHHVYLYPSIYEQLIKFFFKSKL